MGMRSPWKIGCTMVLIRGMDEPYQCTRFWRSALVLSCILWKRGQWSLLKPLLVHSKEHVSMYLPHFLPRQRVHPGFGGLLWAGRGRLPTMGYSVSRVSISTKEHLELMTPGEKFISAMATCSLIKRCAMKSTSNDLLGEHLIPCQYSGQSSEPSAIVISWKKLTMSQAQ